MIIGAHSIVYSKSPEKDRAFFRDILGFPGVDVGGGWLIFGLPPGEVAVHPSDENDEHELYLMCDDVEAFIADMAKRNVACGPVQNMGWGMLTQVVLPGGGKLGVYQPRHARPPVWRAAAAKKKRTKASPRAAGASARKKPATRAKTAAGKKRSRRG